MSNKKVPWQICDDCGKLYDSRLEKDHQCEEYAVDLDPIFETKDSGEREEFSTGSVRDSRTGKGRFDLIPALALKRLAQLYERGADKYGGRNWEKGQPLKRYLDSAARHLNCYMAGERDEDHLIAVAWNMFALVWTENEIKEGRLPEELKK